MKFQEHVGLDLGTASIKLVELNLADNNKFRLLALAQAEAPKFESQIQWDADRANTIKKLLSDAHVNSRKAIISLSESQVYTRVIEMPFLEEPELSQAISWQAEQYIPVPLSDVILKHQVLKLPEQGVPGAKMSVLLLAAPNTTVSNYISVASMAGLEVIAVETEVLAVLRALTAGVAQFPESLLIHIGSETTTFSIFREGVVSLTQSVGTGGTAISRSIGTQLGLDLNQAEQYKRTYGLDEAKFDGKVAGAIKPVVEYILSEAKRVLGSYETHGGNEQVKRVILSGGGSILPGIVPYFVNVLGLETQLGDPFYFVELSSNQRLEIGEAGPIFSVAVGLAMKMT